MLTLCVFLGNFGGGGGGFSDQFLQIHFLNFLKITPTSTPNITSGREGDQKRLRRNLGFAILGGKVHRKLLKQNRDFVTLGGRVHQKWLKPNRCFAILGGRTD